MLIYILVATRYASSPSEGSFLYDCFEAGLHSKEKPANFELEAAITGTGNLRSGSYDFQSKALGGICNFRGSLLEGGRGGMGVL